MTKYLGTARGLLQCQHRIVSLIFCCLLILLHQVVPPPVEQCKAVVDTNRMDRLEQLDNGPATNAFGVENHLPRFAISQA